MRISLPVSLPNYVIRCSMRNISGSDPLQLVAPAASLAHFSFQTVAERPEREPVKIGEKDRRYVNYLTLLNRHPMASLLCEHNGCGGGDATA